MKIVAMIPAREGSKGFPGKNIKNILCKPVISYSILTALKCKKISSVYLNSDSDKYLDIGEKWGAKRYRRPVELAKDNTSMKDVLIDFFIHLNKKQKKFDAIIVLYPTNPLRTVTFITEFLDQFILVGGNFPFISIKKPNTHPFLCYNRNADGNLEQLFKIDENELYRRQQYPDYYRLAGGSYIIPNNYIYKINAQLFCDSSFGYIMPDDEPYIDIDTQLDFDIAEFLMKQYNGKTE
tara:strand:+ start:41 stop:751 length:711 start_codon:yes stop_codon:yes gene_type:complete